MAVYKDIKKLIFDISANTHKNKNSLIEEILYELDKYRKNDHEIIIKAQLFNKDVGGENIVCEKKSFEFMHKISLRLGFKCTASVFDLESAKFLINNFDIPFIKFACDKKYNEIEDIIPHKIKIISSISPKNNSFDLLKSDTSRIYMLCVPSYPAKIDDYPIGFSCISDHVKGLSLYNRDSPIIWEKHLKMETSTGLDAGPFAITPKELRGIL